MDQARAVRRSSQPAKLATGPGSVSSETDMAIPAPPRDAPAPEAGNRASAERDAGASPGLDAQSQVVGHHRHTEPGYIHSKDSQLNRLRRIEGQVRGLHRMVEQDTYCIDILTQISAATRALEAVALGLLDDHLKHCLTEAAANPDTDMNAKLAEASAAIGRLVRA